MPSVWPTHQHEGIPAPDRRVTAFWADRAQLTEALDSACDGLLLLDANFRVAMASARLAENFPELRGQLTPGTRVSRLIAALVRRESFPGDPRDVLVALRLRLLAVPANPLPLRLADGRWLNVTAGATADGGVLVLCTDVTELKQREVGLTREKHLRDIALNNLLQGICLYGPDARVRTVNRRYSELLGVDPDLAVPGASLRSLLEASVAAGHHGTQTVDALEQACLALVARGKPERVMLTLASGREIAFDHVPMPDGGWLASFEDVTERRRTEEKIAFLARHDPLTRLPNRMVLNERLELGLAAAGRGPGFALLCLNLDDFKQVNDIHGHATGDLLLRQAADRLCACARETDFVCRLGGDEFAIVQSDVDRPEAAAELAQRILGALAPPFDIESQPIRVGASIGIAIAPADGAQAEILLRHADMALGRARQEGRGLYRLFERDMDARLQARRAMEADLRQALSVGGLELYYQPLVDLARGRVRGFEALLRWRRRGEMVSPGEFIPLAEETGLIVPIGDWVLRTACAAAADWPAPLRVAVNVSPIQFNGGRLDAKVAAALASTGLAARRLELEITESVLLNNDAANLGVLRAVRAKGVRISMDDFGTGYSSLSYLRSFPFDKIKIDQSFVRDLEKSDGSAAIVSAIIGLGRSLGMRVTAEGVETRGQLAQLRAAGCNEAQGYLFSRPRPLAEVPEIIARIDAELVG